MRFTEFGPSIPNALLDARDAGEVVFLCGAGISIPAGLPDFFRLTSEVARRLGCSPESRAGKLIALEEDNRKADEQNRKNGVVTELREPISFDRILTLLVRDYGASQVENEVAQALRTPRRPNLDHHRALLDLARGPDGCRRLITTNFDRLFQKARPGLRCYEPPHFPDLSGRDGFDGVVHLHGVLPACNPRSLKETSGLVLTSADFGRAYLAEAWATRFISELLDRYIVVLLGYSADDPPVRYLLEGLNASGRIRARRLYAFTANDPARSDRDWPDRGVTPISYDPVDHHRHLWDSIHKWADRARDVGAWRNNVVTLARTPPEQLKAFERGQVAALCSSEEGAKVFASAMPKPPAEWLCVFDSACRYAKPGRTTFHCESARQDVDPLTIYGLDDDPPRPNEQEPERGFPPHLDLLAPLKMDAPVAEEQGIVDSFRTAFTPLNKRLNYLSWWILSVAASPTTVWWAVTRGALHSSLHGWLSRALEDEKIEFAPEVRDCWRLVIEAHEAARHGDQGWYGVNQRDRNEGWTSRGVRIFSAASRPRLTVQRQRAYAPIPPSSDEVFKLSRIGEFGVAFPKIVENIADVSDTSLAAVLAAMRTNLEYGAALENELACRFLRLPTLYPEITGVVHHSDVDLYFLTFGELFKRLAVFDAVAAATEFRKWDMSVRFFVPLSLLALADSRLVSATEFARTIRAMSQISFWSSGHSRELLWALRARWADLSDRDRQKVEKVIIEGPEQYDNEYDQEYAARRAIAAAERLMWMQDNGLRLSTATCAELPRLKSADPRWRDSWARSADEAPGPRSSWVKQETDPAPILDLPNAEVVARCDALSGREFWSFTELDPFRGLVATNPKRAMAVLACEARRNNYPIRYWLRLFTDWPPKVTPQRLKLLAHAGATLPPATIIETRYEVTQWLEDHYKAVDRLDRNAAHRFFDHVVKALSGADVDVLRSGRSYTYIEGTQIPSNRMGVDYAINAPTAHLASALLGALDGRKPKDGEHLPADIHLRLEGLISLPDEGGWHALTTVSQQLHYLYQIDRGWTRTILLPRFDPAKRDAEAAWSGYLRAALLAERHLFKEMRAYFLAAFAATPNWTARGIESLGQHLLLALFRSPHERAYVTVDEARTALRSATAAVRVAALWMLRQSATQPDAWKRVVVPFFRDIWPREQQCQTSETSRTLVVFLEELGERFPDGVCLVADYLVPFPNTDGFIIQFSHDGGSTHSNLTRQYPQEMLILLDRIIDENEPRPPYGLAEITKRLVDAAPDLRQNESWQRLHKMAR